MQNKPLIISKLKLSYMPVLLYSILQTALKFDVNKKKFYEYFQASPKSIAT